jgi:hypothetical protein
VTRARGWFDEALPAGLSRGPASPLYVWDTGKGLQIDLVHIPAGDFQYGNRRLTLAEPFWIACGPTTFAQYGAFCAAEGRVVPQGNRFLRRDDPATSGVENVSWEDARDFCAWAGLDLPTEREWEKADWERTCWETPASRTALDYAGLDLARPWQWCRDPDRGGERVARARRFEDDDGEWDARRCHAAATRYLGLGFRGCLRPTGGAAGDVPR